MNKKEQIIASERFNMLLTREQKQAFKKIASSKGQVMSSELRRLIDEYIAKNNL